MRRQYEESKKSKELKAAAAAKTTPEQREAYEAAVKKWHARLKPYRDACRESERLTAADYAVTINARAEDAFREEDYSFGTYAARVRQACETLSAALSDLEKRLLAYGDKKDREEE